MAPKIEPIAKMVIAAADSGNVIFPLSIIHLDETVRRREQKSRQRLAEFMVRVSKGWAILPASRIIEAEVEDACLKQLGFKGYDLQSWAVRKGLSHMLGAKLQLVARKPLHPDLERKLLVAADSPEALLLAMKQGFGDTVASMLRRAAAAEKLEQIRLLESQIKDNRMRHKATIAQYLLSQIGPRLFTFLSSMNIDPNVILQSAFTNEEHIIRFFRSMPTSYCNAELVFRRDMLKERKIAPNDLHDIMSLSIGIPYSDVVVTEKMWHSIIVQAKLDRLRPTRILGSVQQLPSVLPSG